MKEGEKGKGCMQFLDKYYMEKISHAIVGLLNSRLFAKARPKPLGQD